MFPDDHSSDNIDLDVETKNVQITNNLNCNGIPQQIASVEVGNKDFRTAAQSLNTKQCNTFSLVSDWARKKNHLNSELLTIVEPLRLFITAWAGVGNSYLVKILTKLLTNTFNV